MAPYARATDLDWRDWRLSEVRVPARHAAREATPPEGAAAAGDTKAARGRYEKDSVRVVLHNGEDGILSGMVTDASGETTGLTYAPRMGLRWA